MAVTSMLVTHASPVAATTFDDVTVEDLARASDLVVLGRVRELRVQAHGPNGQPGIHTRALVEVEETWRGQPRAIVEVWVHGGQLGNRLRVLPGQATFQRGERVVLFLFEAGGGFWPTGMGRGKWTVRGATAAPAAELLPTRRAEPALTDLHARVSGTSQGTVRP
jgi:hypothetical protein